MHCTLRSICKNAFKPASDGLVNYDVLQLVSTGKGPAKKNAEISLVNYPLRSFLVFPIYLIQKSFNSSDLLNYFFVPIEC